MEELINLIVNNGIGVFSFAALIYFGNSYLNKMNTTLEDIKVTLVNINESLEDLTNRVTNVEEKISKIKK